MHDSRALRDLLILTKDGEWGKGESSDDLCEMLVIRGTDFEAARYGDLKNIPTRFIPKHIAERKQLQPEDILIETAGGTKDQPTGRTVFLKEDLFRKCSKPITCASFSRFLRVDKSQAFPEYIFWHLQNLHKSGQMEQHQVQHTGVARFQYTKFAERTKIPLPPIEEQRAIARMLGSLDDKIEANRRMNETLEALARTLFKSWFVDFDPVRARAEGRTPAGMDAETAALFPDSFEETELGMVPKGWRCGSLGDVALNPRRVVKPDEIEPRTPYIGLEHMPKCSIALIDWGYAEGLESNKFQFIKGEILYGKLRPYFHKVCVAPLDGICSTDIVVVSPQKSNWFGFVLCLVSSANFVEYTNAGSTGTKMPRTSWNEMANYEFVMPPDQLAEAFTKQILPFIDHIIASIHESNTLAYLRDALLPRLISGEWRV